MKKNFRKLILSLIICILLVTNSICSSLSTLEEAYYLRYKFILETMKNEMNDALKTRNADKDFLYEMIPHHEAAIAMSENILQYGRHPEVSQVAKGIIEEETVELQKMRELLNLMLTTNEQTPYVEQNTHENEHMFAKMEAISYTDNIDKHFLETMIAHHEGGIDMANDILKFSGYLIVKSLAQDMVDILNKEVIQMKEINERIK